MTGAGRFFDWLFCVSSLKIHIRRSGNRLRKKKVSNRHHRTTHEEIWARSGGCPDPLWGLENVCVVAKQLKRGTLIGPSDSAKNPSNRAPPALLFGLLRFSSFEAVQKVAPTAQLINNHSFLSEKLIPRFLQFFALLTREDPRGRCAL